MISLDILVITGTILIIISKFFDYLSTSIKIKNNSDEQNGIARILMNKFGTYQVIWGIFIFVIIFTSLLNVIVFFIPFLTYKFIYFIIELFIAFIQFAVALNNFTNKRNFVTNFLYSFFNKLNHLIK